MSENELDELTAERQIRRLVSTYCDAVGRLDAASAGALFAPDARVKIADFPELVGREAITDGLRHSFAATGFLFQQCDTGLIHVGGNQARARLSVFETNRKPEQADLGVIFGVYEDEYTLLAEGWRFFRRRYTLRLRALVPASKMQQVAGFVPSVAY